MEQKLDPQRAIRDIELIRDILTQSGRASEIGELGRPRADLTQIVAHSAALAASLALLVAELFFDHANTRLLLASSHVEAILQIGIFNLALMLLIGLSALYYLVFSAAKATDSNFQDYVEHHFRYLSNFSFLADLLVKYLTISLVLLAKKPEWFAPLLTLFTADYLFQRRFFTLELRISLILGVICLAISAAQFLLQIPNLEWSLIAFSIVVSFSLIQSVKSFYSCNE